MTSLFLSNNDLCSLRGLECFGGVASLSLGGNLLRRVEDLRPLASLPRLETLSLEVNPVCGAPNYRAHVIASATRSLRVLDRREARRVRRENTTSFLFTGRFDVFLARMIAAGQCLHSRGCIPRGGS